MSHSIEGFKLLYNTLLNYDEPPIDCSLAFKKLVGLDRPTPLEVGEFLLAITENSSGSDIAKYLKYVYNRGCLHLLLPQVDRLKLVAQRKGRLRVSNAFDHTVLVAHYAQSPFISLCAIYHDVGKSFYSGDNFKHHDVKSANLAYITLYHLGIPAELLSRLYFVIRNHMEPHDYQRRVKKHWTDKRVIRFVEACNGLQNTLDTIELAIADKRASHDVDEYILPYRELERRCKELAPEIDFEELTLFCPNCIKECVEADKSCEPTNILLRKSRSTGMYICPMCNGKYNIDDKGRLVTANVVEVVAEVIRVSTEEEGENER